MPPAGEGDLSPPAAVEAGEETPEVTQEAAPDKSAEAAATNIDTANNTAEMADGAEQKQELAPEPAKDATGGDHITADEALKKGSTETDTIEVNNAEGKPDAHKEETIAQEIVDAKPIAEVDACKTASALEPDAQENTEPIAQENTDHITQESTEPTVQENTEPTALENTEHISQENTIQPVAEAEAKGPTAPVEEPQQADSEAAAEAVVLLVKTADETVQPAEQTVGDNSPEPVPAEQVVIKAEQEALKEPEVPKAEPMENVSELAPTVGLEPAVKQEGSELGLTKEATELTVAKEAAMPSIPKDASEPAVHKEASELAAPQETSELAVPKEATELAAPEEASELVVSKEASELASPKKASEHRVPEEVKHENSEPLGQTEASESKNSKTSEAAMLPQPTEVAVETSSPVELPPGDPTNIEETTTDKAGPAAVAVPDTVKSAVANAEKVTSPSPAAAVDHDYEDVTPLASVADYDDVTLLQTVAEEVVVAAIESLAEVAEAAPVEPVDKAADCPPVASPRNKRDSFVEIKEEIVDDLEFIKAKLATPPAAPAKAKRASKEVKEIIEVKEVAKEALKEVKEAEGQEPSVAPEVFSKECIPPVRPERSRRATSRLVVPDWTPPKQTLLGYIFGCFRPHKH